METNQHYSLGSASTHCFYLGKLPQNLYDTISSDIKTLQTEKNLIKYNHLLEGQIDHEYQMKLNPSIENYLIETAFKWLDASPQIREYYQVTVTHFKHMFPPPDSYFNLVTRHEPWINFQTKYEYNPTHHHSGFFSYVIWHSIPYYIEEEHKTGPGKYKDLSNNKHINHNGSFYFALPHGTICKTHNLPVDKTWEGNFAIFPSYLQHGVNPFYSSDKYRITISNNLYLNEEKK